MPKGIDHIDLAVKDVDRSLAFYLGMLGPLGLRVEGRFQTYRGTEEIVYLGFGQNHVFGGQPETRLGLRGAWTWMLGSTARLRRNQTFRATTPSSSSIPMGFGSR